VGRLTPIIQAGRYPAIRFSLFSVPSSRPRRMPRLHSDLKPA
jgi:hypothetical protein